MYKIRDWLMVGKFAHTRDRDLLDLNGIGAMLQLAEAVPQPGIVHRYLAVTDGEPVEPTLFDKGLAFIEQQRQQNKRVLVACGAGISRSTIFAMAALMQTENRTLFDAYNEIYQKHPRAQPHHELCISLAAYHGVQMDLLDVWDGLRLVQKGQWGVAHS